MRVLTWPFRMIFAFVGLLFGMIGRLLSAILGLVFLLVGIIICFTLVGAIVGIPMSILGAALFIRSFF